jgi:DNA polymerase III subunit delta'
MPRKPQAAAALEAPPRPEPPAPFIGHASIVGRFERTGPKGLAHAYLLHGPRGVGKTTFARTLALTLHCERPTSFPLGYCGTCAACHRGLAGSSGDTLLVDDAFISSLDPSSERKVSGVNIDAAREVVRLMQLRSYEGGRQVCIIPRFDDITFDYVYNTFLKELEEPDPGKLFLLTSERPERILPTIRSRTTQIRFAGLTEDEIARALVERYAVAAKRAQSIARKSQGSLGDAIAMRDDDGETAGEAARRWALACLRSPRSLPPMPELGKDDARGALDAVLRGARTALRDCMAYAIAGESATFDQEAAGEYRSTATALGPHAASIAADALALVTEAEAIAATNVSPATVLGWLQIQLRSAALARTPDAARG